MPYYFGNAEKISFGILCGAIVFGLFTNLVGRLFEKSDQQIAEEKCAEVKREAKALGIDRQSFPYLTITGRINGKDYKCN